MLSSEPSLLASPAMSHRPNPTNDLSHSGWSWEQGRAILPRLTVVFPSSDPPMSNNIAAHRSSGVPYVSPYCPPVQEQQAHLTFPSYQPLSEARYDSGHTHGGSYNRASPRSSSADPWRLPLHDPNMDFTSSDLSSPHSVYSSGSSIPHCQPPASPAYPARHSPSRGTVPTAAANTHYQQPMGMDYAALGGTVPSNIQPHYTRVPTAPSLIPYDVPPKVPGPKNKKRRKRLDPRQLESLNEVFIRTEYPSTEQREQLARDLKMPSRKVQVWFQNKRQKNRQSERNPADPSAGLALSPDTPSIAVDSCSSPDPVSDMGEPLYLSRSPLPTMRSLQTPSPPGGRPRAEIDPRRHWPGPSHGY